MNLTRVLVIGLGASLAGAVGWSAKGLPPVPNAVFVLGKFQCDPNEGLKEVFVLTQITGERKFSFACNNQAQFRDQIIPEDFQVPAGASGIVTMKDLKK